MNEEMTKSVVKIEDQQRRLVNILIRAHKKVAKAISHATTFSFFLNIATGLFEKDI